MVRIHVRTPAMPADLAGYRARSDTRWLVEVSLLTGERTRSNNYDLAGFTLLEPLRRVRVMPISRLPFQNTVVSISFSTRERSGTPGSTVVRVEAPDGFVFDAGCLATSPDPRYETCSGEGAVAAVLL